MMVLSILEFCGSFSLVVVVVVVVSGAGRQPNGRVKMFKMALVDWYSRRGKNRRQWKGIVRTEDFSGKSGLGAWTVIRPWLDMQSNIWGWYGKGGRCDRGEPRFDIPWWFGKSGRCDGGEPLFDIFSE